MGLVFLSFSRLPEYGIPVPKHGGAYTHNGLHFIVLYRVHLLVDVLHIRKCLV
jgi:hypothetical protein